MGSFIELEVFQFLSLVSTINVSNDSLGGMLEGDFLGKPSHDASGLTLLVVTLDVGSVSLHEVCHVTSVFPMECHHIASLLDGLGFVVVKEESLLLGCGGVFHRITFSHRISKSSSLNLLESSGDELPPEEKAFQLPRTWS